MYLKTDYDYRLKTYSIYLGNEVLQYIDSETEWSDEDSSSDEENIRSTSATVQPEEPTEYQVTSVILLIFK